MTAKRLVFFVTEDWYFLSHRLPLARAARHAGYDVHVITQLGRSKQELLDEQFEVHPVTLERSSLNPVRELMLVLRVTWILITIRPHIIHNVSLKPVLYSSIAARLLRKVFVVNALTGLGFLYSSESYRARLLKPLVSIVLRFALLNKMSTTIFQNVDDQELLVKNGTVRACQATLIRGSGVDVARFMPGRLARAVPVVALPARLLREKGVYEFVSAARLLTSRGVKARFVLIGGGDESNMGSVTAQELEVWQAEKVVELWGWRKDMDVALHEVDIVALPSYRGEGVPKSLIEAASCGLPIVTTNTPGCRDIVLHGVNGILVPMKSVEPLANALAQLVVDSDMRRAMGVKGRERVITNFSQEIVVKATLDLYASLIPLSATT